MSQDRELIVRVLTKLGLVSWLAGSCLTAVLLRLFREILLHGIGWDVLEQQLISVVVPSLLGLLLPALLIGPSVHLLARLLPSFGHPLSRLLGTLGGHLAGWVVLGLWVLPRSANPEYVRDTMLVGWVVSALVDLGVWVGFRLDRTSRDRVVQNRVTQLSIDSLLILIAMVVAYLARFDGLPPERFRVQMLVIMPYVLLYQLAINYVCGVYRFVWRLIGIKEVLSVSRCMAISFISLLILNQVLNSIWGGPRVPIGVVTVYSLLLLCTLLGVRVLRRVQYAYTKRSKPEKRPKNFVIAGAGRTGLLLLQDLESRSNVRVIGLLDDDPIKQGCSVHGVRVLGTTRDLKTVVEKHTVDQLILCMPRAEQPTLRRIVADAESLSIPALTVPSIAELALGPPTTTGLRPVRMEDLLGRALVTHPQGELNLIRNYHQKRILVTGAGGSIGSELCRQLLGLLPEQIILLDRDENNLFEIGIELAGTSDSAISEVIADVRDRRRMERVFSQFRPQVVFHAAAYKHVPMMELHPQEAILNNVLGSLNVVELSASFEVETFTLISTDKAVNPTNIMGASKRIAELLVQRQVSRRASLSGRFCCVRFGNVLGSRASVVPLFQKRIAERKILTVTHPEIRRYFMTIPEAVQLVLKAGSLGEDGEIFLLDMGNPVKIVDLARELIEQYGLVPGKDIKIEYSGLRPGEKLFEELLIGAEKGVRNTKYPKIFVGQVVERDWEEFDSLLNKLWMMARADDANGMGQVLRRFGIGYQNAANSPIYGESPQPSLTEKA